MKYLGACHCGNLEYEFETALAPEALPVRACQCGFCRAHGALSTSDPQGSVAIRAKDASRVQRYRFGLGITDFLVCRDCGVYLLAMMEIDGAPYAVLSANVLDCRDRMGPSQPMDYDGEDAAGRPAPHPLDPHHGPARPIGCYTPFPCIGYYPSGLGASSGMLSP